MNSSNKNPNLKCFFGRGGGAVGLVGEAEVIVFFYHESKFNFFFLGGGGGGGAGGARVSEFFFSQIIQI